VLRQAAQGSGFTSGNNTYVVSSTIVSPGQTTASADECVALCSNDASCTYWAWCPSDQTAGCTVPGVAGAASTTQPAQSCVLSYDETEGRNVVYSASGAGIAFVGGSYNPVNVAPTTTTGANDPASWIDPNGTPSECSGWFAGNQWAGDEIECHVCNGDYQLKCDLDTDLIGDDSVKCEFDSAGLGSLVNNAKEFACTVDFSKTPQNQCDWADLQSTLPTCAVEPVRRIMATWRPDE